MKLTKLEVELFIKLLKQEIGRLEEYGIGREEDKDSIWNTFSIHQELNKVLINLLIKQRKLAEIKLVETRKNRKKWDRKHYLENRNGYYRRYNLEHKEKRKKYNQEYWKKYSLEHKEELKKHQSEYRLKNRKQLLKRQRDKRKKAKLLKKKNEEANRHTFNNNTN